MRTSRFINAIAGVVLLVGCAPQTETHKDLSEILGSSVAATALEYMIKVNPKMSEFVAGGDAFIKQYAPTVLKYACGGISQADLVVKTLAIIAPKWISSSTLAELALARPLAEGYCSANLPPTSLADAAVQMFRLYQKYMQAVSGAVPALRR